MTWTLASDWAGDFMLAPIRLKLTIKCSYWSDIVGAASPAGMGKRSHTLSSGKMFQLNVCFHGFSFSSRIPFELGVFFNSQDPPTLNRGFSLNFYQIPC